MFKLNNSIELENPRRGRELFNPKSIASVFLISSLYSEDEEMLSSPGKNHNYIIHTLDKKSTDTLLDELDTVQDFVDYLRAKESLLNRVTKLILLGGEQELLASYLLNNRSFARFEEANQIIITEGSWESLKNKPEYINKKKSDEVSYFWDSLINIVHTCGKQYEPVARELAKPSRFQRRYLSTTFLDAYGKAKKLGQQDSICKRIFPVDDQSITYCFLFQNISEKPKNRKAYLNWLCYIARGTTNNTRAIGIATDINVKHSRFYDFCFLDMPIKTQDNQKEMIKMQQETGVMTHYQESRIDEKEYPDSI